MLSTYRSPTKVGVHLAAVPDPATMGAGFAGKRTESS
jgi:hypothetical protein